MSATPRPWAIRWGLNVMGPDRHHPQSERLVANVGSHSNNVHHEAVGEENLDNALLIVRAVNAYDAHVQAVEALRAIESSVFFLGLHLDEDGCEGCRLKTAARTALAAVDEASR